jgi:7,8-dihydropterin-6-yl-methyl-4-(beta-D-ribofuranosyl)aminobenzene 5'-phosphate synthase
MKRSADMLEVTILCDNIVGIPLGIGEHGFSAFVERSGESILFDTGRGTGIVPNSLAFGKDLREVKKICISHGHFDHSEGIVQVLALARGAEVCAHPDIFQVRIADRKDEKGILPNRRFVGIPYRREHLELMGANFRLDREFREIAEGIFLTGEVPRKTSFEKGEPSLMVPSGEGFVQDPFSDDQSLVIRTPKGLVVVFGCAHSGVINTLLYARERTGEDRIHAVLGGTHLGFLSEEQQERSIRELKALNPQVVAVSHCTGMKAAFKLMQEFGERFSFAHVGSSFQFD